MAKSNVARPRSWSDKDVAKLIAATCAWKDGLRPNGQEWQSVLANFVIAAVGVKGAPPLATARGDLRKLLEVA